MLVKVGDKAVASGQDVAAFSKTLTAGQTISIVVMRDGKELELKGTALARPSDMQVGQQLGQ